MPRTQLAGQAVLPMFAEQSEAAALRAAADTGPRAWRTGVYKHLSRPGCHGHACLTCTAYAMGYDLDWPAYDPA